MGSLKSTCLKVTIRATMFLAYLFTGAGLFILLESSNQDQIDEKTKTALENLKSDLRQRKNITEEEFSQIQKMIERALDVGVIGSKTFLKSWDFANAFFFCGNVITTIGYGHITPRTMPGQIVVMIYALFGIPLTGFFLRTVGNELTTLIAYVIKYYERRMMNRESEKLEIKCAVVSMVLALVMLMLGSAIFSSTEASWQYDSAFYFCFVTLTTIGFGDFVPGESRDQFGHGEKLIIEIASLVYYVLGLSIMSGVIVSISGVIEEKTKKLDIGDPMDAIRNLRLENLNSKAMKKLGYKMDDGVRMPPLAGGMPKKLSRQHTNHIINTSSVNQNRRGTIIPDDTPPRPFRTPSVPASAINEKPRKGSLFSDNKECRVDITPTPSARSTPNSPALSCTRSSCATLHEENENNDDNNNNSNYSSNSNITGGCRGTIRNIENSNTISTTAGSSGSGEQYISLSDHELDKKANSLNDSQSKQDIRCAITIISPVNDSSAFQGSKKELIGQVPDDDDDEARGDDEYTYEEVLANNHAPKDGRSNQKPHPKKFILNDNNKRLYGGNNSPINFTGMDYNNLQANSLTKPKSDIHRKISRERKKPITKLLKHTSSLKDLKIQYSSNLQSQRKEKKFNKAQGADSKRVGLPAELFANDVCFTVKNNNNNNDRLEARHSSTSFYSIPMNSPVASYTNPYFYCDDLPTTTSSLELPLRNDQGIEIKRPCTADLMNNL